MGYSERYKKLISEGVVNSKYDNKLNKASKFGGKIKKEDLSDKYLGDKQLYNELPNDSEKEYRKLPKEDKMDLDETYKQYKKLDPELDYEDTKKSDEYFIKYGKFRKA